MIIDLHFGYTDRHHIYYDTERKSGTIKLWSSYSGSITGSDSSETQDDPASNTVIHNALTETLFRGNQHTEFSIGDEQDLLSMLASLVAVKSGHESSFISKEGRRIAFSLRKQGAAKKNAINVAIQYGRAAKLTMGEAHKLHTIVMDVLRELGYSDKEISEKLGSIPQVSK